MRLSLLLETRPRKSNKLNNDLTGVERMHASVWILRVEDFTSTSWSSLMMLSFLNRKDLPDDE